MTTGNTQLRTIAGASVEEKDPATFPGMLKKYSNEIARALPKHINAERMARVALTCFRQNPLLAKCEPASVFAAVVQAAQLGLEPGLNGRAYLVPYYNSKAKSYECQFIPGWKGLVELANRTGRASCWTGAVFEGDEFEYALGDSPYVRHRPGIEDDPAKLIYTYAIGRTSKGEWPVVEVWPVKKIEKHRDRYNKVGDRHYSHGNWEMYARKVPLLQVLKYLPASPELETAMVLNDAAEVGQTQGLTIEGALSGEPPRPPAIRVDPETGEIMGSGQQQAIPPEGTSAGLQRAVSDIRNAIQRATTVDQVALQQDMARHVKDDKLRGELETEAKAKLRELGETSGA